MQPEIRRIIAVDAYRRCSGGCPTTIHSLGTGETFGIEPAANGFTDLESGIRAVAEVERIVLPGGAGPIEIEVPHRHHVLGPRRQLRRVLQRTLRRRRLGHDL